MSDWSRHWSISYSIDALGPLPARTHRLIEQAAGSSMSVLLGACPGKRNVLIFMHDRIPLCEMYARYPALSCARRGYSDTLLEGETGTGKSYLARWIHRLSPRAGQPFVSVNCATLPQQLIETELFGHERGTFTDAKQSRPGLVEKAHGGTLFLDEIAELPMNMQAKLLTVLDEHWIRRVGGRGRIPVDVRIICATNQKLAECVARGEFREDLYYRCCGLPIRLLPLRERRRDIPILVRLLLQRIAHSEDGRNSAQVLEIQPEALEKLCELPLPGNIRQLEHALRLASLNAAGTPIASSHLPDEILDISATVSGHSASDEPTALRRRKSRYVAPPDEAAERRKIVAALKRTGGNKTQAARYLGMSRQVLWERLHRYRIEPAEWSDPGPEPLAEPG